jgi:molecular chaperone GrpE
MNDVAEKPESEPQVRVVDRRWWARGESDDVPADSGTQKPTYVEGLEQQLADRAAQLQNVAAEHRRALEEFEQVKIRMRRDVAREVERGRRAVLAELLEVIDNLDRAIAAGRTDVDSSLLQGIELVRQQFLSKLESFGVSRVEAIGQPFDARRHEAVSTAAVKDPAQDDTVIAVLKEGYAVGDDVLRPASVVVGKA